MLTQVVSKLGFNLGVVFVKHPVHPPTRPTPLTLTQTDTCLELEIKLAYNVVLQQLRGSCCCCFFFFFFDKRIHEEARIKFRVSLFSIGNKHLLKRAQYVSSHKIQFLLTFQNLIPVLNVFFFGEMSTLAKSILLYFSLIQIQFM